ncbi:MAG: GPP34 family phosphoprotein, partial [Henriciella sp.]
EQAASLVDKGILAETDKSFLVFSWKHYPERDGRAEADLVAHLSDVMFADKVPTDADRVIVALAEKTGLLKRNFDKAKLRANKVRIKQIIEGVIEPANATIKAIDGVIAALIAASAAGAAASATG